jgi:hypothetical protein
VTSLMRLHHHHVTTDRIQAISGRRHAMRDRVNATRRGIHPIGYRMLLILRTVNAARRRIHAIHARMNLAWRTVNAIGRRILRAESEHAGKLRTV